MRDELQRKYDRLIQVLQGYESIAIAFSGGVDSTFLLYAAREALKGKVVALTISTPYVPRWELAEAREIAKSMGVEHRVEELDFDERLRMNPADHCYTCKKMLFTHLLKVAEESGYGTLVEGTNIDDLQDYRPGLVALRELEVISPMVKAGLSKAEIREISQYYNLPTWNKPSFACLLSRMPIGKRVEEKAFLQVEKAERYLMDKGFNSVRVRHHGDVARIELPKEKIVDIIEPQVSGDIDRALKSFGYKHVSIDLAGYTMGSLNRPDMAEQAVEKEDE